MNIFMAEVPKRRADKRYTFYLTITLSYRIYTSSFYIYDFLYLNFQKKNEPSCIKNTVNPPYFLQSYQPSTFIPYEKPYKNHY